MWTTRAPRRSSSGACKRIKLWILILILVLICSVEELAKKKGVSMAQISIAWSLSKDGTSRLRPHCLFAYSFG